VVDGNNKIINPPFEKRVKEGGIGFLSWRVLGIDVRRQE
jgi:hypothetical protein